LKGGFMEKVLEGKSAVVTGSSKGLGRAFAMGLAEAGAKVIVNGTVADDVAKVVKEIKEKGGEAAGCTESVGTMAGGQRIIQSALDKFGRLDILVNNAGNLRDRTLLKMTEEDWDSVIAVHLKGPFACSQAAARIMSEQKSGRIMNVTSGAAFWGVIGQCNYSAAKAGILGLTFAMALELKKYNITVNAIWPRAITRMTQTLVESIIQRTKEKFQETGEHVSSALDVGLGEPEMVAPLVVFLASDEAADITGKIFGLRGEILSAWSPPREVATAIMLGGWTVDEIRKRFRLTLGNAV
jgi:3-oxoacyl-[acyl-carrier protein] reductase